MTKQTRSGYCKECWSCDEPCGKTKGDNMKRPEGVDVLIIGDWIEYADYLEFQLKKVPKTTTTGADVGIYVTDYVEWLEQRVKELSSEETT